MAHLEDKAVDLARSLQFTDARLSQQAAQHTVVAFEQLRKKTMLTPGSLTMNVPSWGTTSRLCDPRYCDMV